MKHNTSVNLAVFSALVTLGTVGRIWQPDANFTPVVAVGLFAAYFFSEWFIAALVPLAVMAVSNYFLPAYDAPGVMIVVYASLLLPVVLGRWLRSNATAWRLGVGCVGPAVIFFLTTNFAHWMFMHNYPPTIDGLIECYIAGIPFFRSMLAGDLCYTALVFGSYGLAVSRLEAWQLARSNG